MDSDWVSKLPTESNWDGYDALVPNPQSVATAIELLEMLEQAGMPAADVGPGNDGDIWLDYGNSNRRVFSIAVTSKRRLFYAGLIGTRVWNGGVDFTDSVPQEILDGIQLVAGEPYEQP